MSDDRAPQHVDLDLERELLGGVLVSGDPGPAQQAGVVAETFFRAVHRQVWRAILAVAADDAPVNLVTVGDMLRAHKVLEDVGPAYYAALVDGVPRGGVPWQAERLVQLAQARAADQAIGRMREALADPDALIDGTLETHVDLVAGLVANRRSSPVLSPAAQWAALVAEARRDTSRRVRLGLPAIDDVLGGLRPGEVCGLMARPGAGKTVTVCHAVSTLAAAQRSVLVVSLEMPAAQILARLAGMVYQERPAMVWSGAREGRHTADEWAERMPKLAVCDTPGLSVSDIQATIRHLETPPELVVIDYLGLIGGDPRLSTYDRVSKQARELKDVAKRCDTAILLVIQVSREAGGSFGEKALSLGAARDSGVVEEALDYLVGMRRFDRLPTLEAAERQAQTNLLWFSVLKNRHGRVPSEEWAYWIHETDLHLVEQAEPVQPASVANGSLYDFGKRGRR